MLLISFSMHEFDKMNKFLINTKELMLWKKFENFDMPDLEIEPYHVIINVLGLRSLISAGMLPVKKAFIKFSVKSLLPSEKAKAVDDIYTIPDEGGVDPNIRTCLKFKV